MEIDKETMERIIKCVVMYNGGKVDFDKDFLKLYDHIKLSVEDNGNCITLKGLLKLESGNMCLRLRR